MDYQQPEAIAGHTKAEMSPMPFISINVKFCIPCSHPCHKDKIQQSRDLNTVSVFVAVTVSVSVYVLHQSESLQS